MHIMDDFVEMDDSQDGGDTPVAMRPGANRRPTAMLRPLSGTSDRQCAPFGLQGYPGYRSRSRTAFSWPCALAQTGAPLQAPLFLETF